MCYGFEKMTGNDDNDSSRIKVAIIGGIFLVLAACISGLFPLINTLIEKDRTSILPNTEISITPPVTILPQGSAPAFVDNGNSTTSQNAQETFLTIEDKTNNILRAYRPSAGINSPASCPGIYLETGASEIIYEMIVPSTWVVIIDSWKAEWVTGSYQKDGILVITGEWQGEVKINTGAICAVSVEKAQTAIEYRLNLTGNDGRSEYFVP